MAEQHPPQKNPLKRSSYSISSGGDNDEKKKKTKQESIQAAPSPTNNIIDLTHDDDQQEESPPPPETATGLSDVDDRVAELAQKAISKSGNQFFATLQRRVAAYIDLSCGAEAPEEADEFEAVRDVCTPDNLVLLARHYAGEIPPGKRKKRAGVVTNAMKVKQLLANTPARLILEIILLAALMEAAKDECDAREANAEESEHWSNEYAGEDAAEMWASRREVLEDVGPWDDASEAAKSGDWEGLETAISELNEIEE